MARNTRVQMVVQWLKVKGLIWILHFYKQSI
jgi:hypothetical protein